MKKPSVLKDHPYLYLTGNCLGMIIIACVLVLAAYFFADWYTKHGEVVEVPDITGKSFDEAEELIDDADLEIEVIDTGYNKALAAGIILEQDIDGGTRVKPGRVIRVKINSGQARLVALPDLADNCSLREAMVRLKNVGFTQIRTEQTMGDKDWVYGIKVGGKTVAAGTRVSVDTPITIVVGDGLNEEVFNGNDSLYYEINGFEEEEDEIDESIGEETDEPSKTVEESEMFE